ncbi:bifunctional 2-polyprenyl-6-hydroxyphenol methylase/3-demethylubiquinol 3-O-methyltransferase UbiG [Pleurocapsa sp. PCC 7319]|uniref:class I SAM-dependent methyltransferase n=1 Tax=Pleurocapsa sp. PCC 7319 TaxID=118161 RepID=UPI00034B6CEC|nr:class I SAM-dependent methyltransferase [Pleurocapsa sp. PCC 7319]
MNKNLTQKIQDDFDRLALYDQNEWDHNNHYHQFLIKQLPGECHTVLDLGCGVGKFSRLLARYTDEVVAIDLSPKSIEVAEQRSTGFTNIDFQVADISQWQFPPAHFDAIASIATVHHLTLEDLLPKLKASLKPGGVLIILDLLKHHNIQDTLIDLIAIPQNWWFLATKNQHIQPSPEAVEAMREHLRTDEYLNFSQVKKIYTNSLKTPKIRRHLFWRYSVVWDKP